jgi:hypothetical protein
VDWAWESKLVYEMSQEVEFERVESLPVEPSSCAMGLSGKDIASGKAPVPSSWALCLLLARDVAVSCSLFSGSFSLRI